MGFNLATCLEQTATSAPDDVFIYFDEQVLTFSEVDGAARRVATGLTRLGLRPGDRVVVQLPNVPEFVYAYFGILKAGMTVVPVNPMLTGPEIQHQIEDSSASAVITHHSTAETVVASTGRRGAIPVVVVGSGSGDDFGALLAAEPLQWSYPCAPEDTAVVLYTSGTTGRPKGAELTHFQMFMNCTVAGELFGVGPGDVMAAALPLFHVFGLSNVLNVAARYGVALALIRRFEVDTVIHVLEQRGVTVFPGVPTMFVALLNADCEGRDLTTLNRGISGGASMPVEVIRGIESKFDGFVVLEGYGLSETASCSAFNIDAVQRKVASVGKPIWGVDMRIVDSDGRDIASGPDRLGEIAIRGHNVMKGYLGRPEATAEAIRDGWFHSGDLGYVDEDGYFYVVDRLKDLIIRGGYNVYPRELEEAFYDHPEVVEAAVVGRPDERLGEEVVAYVVIRTGSTITVEDLDKHCRERLAAYKYPREICILTELPKGATGKILKRELRTEAASAPATPVTPSASSR